MPKVHPLLPSSPWFPQPTGERLVFTVPSRSGDKPHRVDLGAYHGNGACDCGKFVFGLEKHLAGGAWPAPDLECWHIRIAKWAYCLIKIAEEKALVGEVDDTVLTGSPLAILKAQPGEWAAWERMPDDVRADCHALVKVSAEISRCGACTLHRLDFDGKQPRYMFL